MKHPKPPEGVRPYGLWWEHQGCSPGMADLLERYRSVDAAVVRYREAGQPVPVVWLLELGVKGVRGG